MGVSKNRGTPKSSILIGFSIINHPFWGTPIFGNTQICFTFFNMSLRSHPHGPPGRYQKDPSPTVSCKEFLSLWGFGEVWGIFPGMWATSLNESTSLWKKIDPILFPKPVHFDVLLGQWLNFKLFGITYLVGKIRRSNLFFSGSRTAE